MCPCIATPRELKPFHMLANRNGARLVDSECVVIEHILADFASPYRLGLVHFPADTIGALCSILVSSDCLRPKTERALCRATSPRIERHVRMQQVADKIL